MKKIFFIFIFLFLLSNNVCFAKNMKFVQITDVWYGKDNSAEILDNAIKEINKMKGIKFVIFTGDNTAYADKELMKNFISSAKKLNKPFYIAVGDKDMSKNKNLEREVYTKQLHKYLGHKYPKSLNYSFKFRKSNVLFITLDGAKDFIIMPNGYFTPKTLDWLDNEIKNNQDKKIVILQHFPIATMPKNEFTHTVNAKDYLKLINQYNNVISVVAGHYNVNEEDSFNGVYYIVTPSLTQKCYKLIEIDEDNGYQVFTSLIKMD